MQALVATSDGPGAIIGHQLRPAVQEIVYLDRTRRAYALDRNRLVVSSHLGDVQSHVRSIEAAEIFSTYGLIILAVSAHEVSSLVEVLPRAIGPKTIVVSFVEGLEHIDRLKAACPGTVVLDGLHGLDVEVDAGGTVKHIGGNERLLLGGRIAMEKAAAEIVAALFKESGLVVRVVADAEHRRWERLVRVVAIGGLAALMQTSISEITAIDVGNTHLWTLMEECVTIATASGQRIDIGRISELMQGLSVNEPEMMAGRINRVVLGDVAEITELVMQMQRAGRATNTSAPLLDVVATALAARHHRTNETEIETVARARLMPAGGLRRRG